MNRPTNGHGWRNAALAFLTASLVLFGMVMRGSSLASKQDVEVAVERHLREPHPGAATSESVETLRMTTSDAISNLHQRLGRMESRILDRIDKIEGR